MEGKVLGISSTDFGAAAAAAAAAADDFKYVCGLSTILVATIQEVKDRVSQMEFIFCSQLFPHIQANSKLLQARHADDATATTAAEDEWRKRESGLVSQLEEISSGKRRAEDRLLQLESSLEEMQGRLVVAARLAAEHDSEKKQLQGRLEELICGKRGAEDRLLQLETSLEEMKRKLVDAARLAADHDAEKKQLLGRLQEEMKKDEVIRRLQREIGEKAAEISREREAHQQLQQQMESKDKDLLLEQNRVSLVTATYKGTSQYNHLLKNIDQNQGSKIDQNEGSKSPVNQKTSISPPSKRKLKDLHNTEKENIPLVSMSKDKRNASSSSAKTQQTPRATTARSLISNSRLTLPSRPTNQRQKNAASAAKTDLSRYISTSARPGLGTMDDEVAATYP